MMVILWLSKPQYHTVETRSRLIEMTNSEFIMSECHITRVWLYLNLKENDLKSLFLADTKKHWSTENETFRVKLQPVRFQVCSQLPGKFALFRYQSIFLFWSMVPVNLFKLMRRQMISVLLNQGNTSACPTPALEAKITWLLGTSAVIQYPDREDAG
jgi:hypothetical protein